MEGEIAIGVAFHPFLGGEAGQGNEFSSSKVIWRELFSLSLPLLARLAKSSRGNWPKEESDDVTPRRQSCHTRSTRKGNCLSTIPFALHVSSRRLGTIFGPLLSTFLAKSADWKRQRPSARPRQVLSGHSSCSSLFVCKRQRGQPPMNHTSMLKSVLSRAPVAGQQRPAASFLNRGRA